MLPTAVRCIRCRLLDHHPHPSSYWAVGGSNLLDRREHCAMLNARHRSEGTACRTKMAGPAFLMPITGEELDTGQIEDSQLPF